MNRWVCLLLSFCLLGLFSCKACDCTVPEPTRIEDRVVIAPEPKPPAPKPPAPKPAPVEEEAEVKEPIVTHREIVSGESGSGQPAGMDNPVFNDKLNPTERKAILLLQKAQKTDPRFIQKPSGVPTSPPEEEKAFRGGGKKRKKRNK